MKEEINNHQMPDKSEIFSVGNVISFTYRGGRKVIGQVESKGSKLIWLVLHTDYIGKNEEWYSGETKLFYTSLCKKAKLIKKSFNN